MKEFKTEKENGKLNLASKLDMAMREIGAGQRKRERWGGREEERKNKRKKGGLERWLRG